MGWHGFQNHISHSGLISWPVRDGCGQYTLTVEQLAQKAFKRAMTRSGHAVKPYSGWWLPFYKFGCRTGCLNVPKTDETRLSISIGDKVNVTRIWGERWWYGEIYQFADKSRDPSKEPRENVRGWFPSSSMQLDDLSEEPVENIQSESAPAGDAPAETKKDQ